MADHERPVNNIVALTNAKRSGNGYMAKCDSPLLRFTGSFSMTLASTFLNDALYQLSYTPDAAESQSVVGLAAVVKTSFS